MMPRFDLAARVLYFRALRVLSRCAPRRARSWAIKRTWDALS